MLYHLWRFTCIQHKWLYIQHSFCSTVRQCLGAFEFNVNQVTESTQTMQWNMHTVLSLYTEWLIEHSLIVLKVL